MDRLIIEFDKALRSVFAPAPTYRPVAWENMPEPELSESEKRHVVGLMRVNHCGEICAQALYQGQAAVAKDPEIKVALERAGREETEHLAWTERRIAELGGRKSVFNPLWYAGALAIGVAAGRLGDGWNLGFLSETERQVESHLDGHLDRLPPQDAKSQAIIEQMKADEVAHADMADQMGARELPVPVKMAMKMAAKVMTKTAYYL